MTLLLILSTLLGLEKAFVPYLDTVGQFHPNYTGQCVEGTPLIGYTLIGDSLGIDSLLEIYPSVVLMDSLAFNNLMVWGLAQ